MPVSFSSSPCKTHLLLFFSIPGSDLCLFPENSFLIYPLMKRITYFPQAWLGIAMNFSLVVGWASVTGSLDYELLLVLLVGAWGWTMHYGQ